jgi:hypothetical protein
MRPTADLDLAEWTGARSGGEQIVRAVVSIIVERAGPELDDHPKILTTTPD